MCTEVYHSHSIQPHHFTSLVPLRYFVYLKLFVTMGGNWIAEIVSGTLPENSYLGIVLDVTNSLQVGWRRSLCKLYL